MDQKQYKQGSSSNYNNKPSKGNFKDNYQGNYQEGTYSQNDKYQNRDGYYNKQRGDNQYNGSSGSYRGGYNQEGGQYRGRGGYRGGRGRGGYDHHHRDDRNEEKKVITNQDKIVNANTQAQTQNLKKTSKGLFSSDFDLAFGPKNNDTPKVDENTAQNNASTVQNQIQTPSDRQQKDEEIKVQVQQEVEIKQVKEQEQLKQQEAQVKEHQKQSSHQQEQVQQVNKQQNSQNKYQNDRNRQDYNDRQKQYDGRFKNYQEKRDFQKKNQHQTYQNQNKKEDAKSQQQQQNGPSENQQQNQGANPPQDEKKKEKFDFIPDPNFQWSLDLDGVMSQGKKKKKTDDLSEANTNVPFVIQSNKPKNTQLKENVKMKLAQNLEFSTIHIDKINKGFTNTTNCCYMNVILQSLLSIPAFFNMLIAISDNQDVMKELGPDSLLRKFVYLSLYFNPSQQLDRKNPFAASTVDAEKIFAELNQNFNPYQEHQDCHEFLALLLDLLHDELKLIYVPSEDKDSKGVVDEWQEVGSKNAKCQFNNMQEHIQQSLIRDIFGGIVRNEFQVDRSSKVSVTYEPFFFLNLEVNKSETLEECLTAFFKAKPLNDYKIDGKEVRATHQQQIDKLPNILILQLKRFVYRNGPVKMSDYIEFPEVLRIQDNCLSNHLKLGTFNTHETDDAGRSYRLTSIVEHKGTQLSRGHYICYVLDASNNWIQYDDNKIKKMHNVDKVYESEAYLLFYELIV